MRINKKWSALALMGAMTFGFAQEKMMTKKVDEKSWFHSSFAETGVYGVNTAAAYEFLKQNNRQPVELVVGILDSGMDFEHEDLAANMWVNKKEVAGNGVDDDKNGYVDDVYGWNFLGGKDGSVGGETLEVTRLYRKWKAVFETGDAAKDKANQTKMPKEYTLYKGVKAEFEETAQQAEGNLANISAIMQAVKEGFPSLAKQFGAKKLSAATLSDFKPETPEGEKAFRVFGFFSEEDYDGKTVEEFQSMVEENLQGGLDYYKGQMEYNYNVNFNGREIVGDDFENKREIGYGNTDFEGPDAFHGTHVGGLVAAVRGNNKGIDGVAGNSIRLMTVRTVPDGDEYDKDVANAIRYAVDNGAKILNMSFGKAYSPEKELVWEAMQYAESKNVLMVKAAGNSNEDIDVKLHYPTNWRDAKTPVTESVLTVGANTMDPENLKSGFSNFGKRSVDVFAPGSAIYSTVPDNKYRNANGTSMASPVTAGVAALVWSHYPYLTAKEVRQIVMKTVNKNDQLADISVTGGVVDAYKAVQAAEEMYKAFNKKELKKRAKRWKKEAKR